MKITKLMFPLIVVMLATVACTPNKKAPKALVLYYSLTSNTQVVAQEIATRLEADIEPIIALNPYDTAYNATIARSLAEREQGITPEIKPLQANLDDYDLIFIGYPVWFGTYASPVITFLTNTDLSGKRIVPFCTFGSGGLESSVAHMAEQQPQAQILPGYGVRAARLSAVPHEVDQFLKASGFIKGDYVKLPDFSVQTPVSEDDAAIFDAAVDGYRMIHAEAKTVASRAIPGGMEYLFTAVNLPRDAQAAPASPSEMQVYVTVLEGESPVFTKVVR